MEASMCVGGPFFTSAVLPGGDCWFINARICDVDTETSELGSCELDGCELKNMPNQQNVQRPSGECKLHTLEDSQFLDASVTIQSHYGERCDSGTIWLRWIGLEFRERFWGLGLAPLKRYGGRLLIAPKKICVLWYIQFLSSDMIIINNFSFKQSERFEKCMLFNKLSLI